MLAAGAAASPHGSGGLLEAQGPHVSHAALYSGLSPSRTLTGSSLSKAASSCLLTRTPVTPDED